MAGPGIASRPPKWLLWSVLGILILAGAVAIRTGDLMLLFVGLSVALVALVAWLLRGLGRRAPRQP